MKFILNDDSEGIDIGRYLSYLDLARDRVPKLV